LENQINNRLGGKSYKQEKIMIKKRIKEKCKGKAKKLKFTKILRKKTDKKPEPNFP